MKVEGVQIYLREQFFFKHIYNHPTVYSVLIINDPYLFIQLRLAECFFGIAQESAIILTLY